MTGRGASAVDWRDDVEALRPTVLLLGGFLTAPPFYRPMVRRLLDRGIASVTVANVWTPEWLLASVLGLGPILGRAEAALERASAAAAASPLSRGAPLLVIGHSAGGILARLLTADEPFRGRRYAAADAIGAIVTLGSPHHLDPRGNLGRRLEAVAVRFADRTVPGAFHAPRVGYVAVASRAVTGRPDGTGRERVAFRLYQALRQQPGVSSIEGDGVVPVAAALLEGARGVILDEVVHGQAAGQPWYGTDQGLDGWWDEAIAAWRTSLRVRAAERPRQTAARSA